jgi:hypothetical protein
MRGKLEMLLLASALAAAAPARASLGGTADSVEADRKALSAVRRATVARAGYTVQEVEAGATLVREYVSPAGVVFAVAWNGLAHPDLDTLLGSYAAAWREADQQVPRSPGRRWRAVRTARLVVEKWGHMRNLQGRAYDPALLPPGMDVDAIR